MVLRWRVSFVETELVCLTDHVSPVPSTVLGTKEALLFVGELMRDLLAQPHILSSPPSPNAHSYSTGFPAPPLWATDVFLDGRTALSDLSAFCRWLPSLCP